MTKTILNNDFFKQVLYKKAGLKDQIGLINCPAFIKFLLQISFSLEHLLSVSNTLRHKNLSALKLNLNRFIETLRQVRDMILQSLKFFLDRLSVILYLKSEIFVTKTYQITQPKAMVIGFDTFKSWGRREEILIDKSLRKRGFSLDLKLGFMKKFVWVRCQQWRQQGLFKKSVSE